MVEEDEYDTKIHVNIVQRILKAPCDISTLVYKTTTKARGLVVVVKCHHVTSQRVVLRRNGIILLKQEYCNHPNEQDTQNLRVFI